MKTKIVFWPTLIGIVIYLLGSLLIAFLLGINPAFNYSGLLKGMGMGLIHGLLWIPNSIYLIFDPARLLKAVLHDGWYTFGWWIGAILLAYNILSRFFPIFSLLKKG